MRIRSATANDRAGIRAVHEQAFPAKAEADLVEQLADDGDAIISLVADDGKIVGHILLSRMTAEADGRPLRALGLAPVAVVPGRQRERIGSKLIDAAISQARAAGEDMLFLFGEASFYARFGFSADAAKPFASPYAGRYFQALALSDMPAVTAGKADYAAAFSDLG